jgi:chromosome partitioning protein
MAGANLRKQVEQMKSKYDHIVIDTGGRDTTSQRAALSVTDIAMIPFAPRSFDLWTINRVIDVIDEIQAIRDVPFTPCVFLSRADIRSADNREVAQALAAFKQLSFLPHPISNRKAFSNAAGMGLAVFEAEIPDLKAVAEINALFNTVLHGNHVTTST